MKKTIVTRTITAASFFAIISNNCMDPSNQLARSPSPKELNGAITRHAQEKLSLRTQVESDLCFTGDCKIDLSRIILYIHQIAEEYDAGSRQAAYYDMLMAQIALDRLDTCMTRYCGGEIALDPTQPSTHAYQLHCQFVKQKAGSNWLSIFINALTTLGLVPPG